MLNTAIEELFISVHENKFTVRTHMINHWAMVSSFIILACVLRKGYHF